MDELIKRLDLIESKLTLAPRFKLAYSTEEAAEALGVPIAKINLWRNEGLLTGIKSGTGFIFSVYELIDFLDKNKGKQLSNSDYCKIAMIEGRG